MKPISKYIYEAFRINSKTRLERTEVNTVGDLRQIIQEKIKKCKDSNNTKLDLSFLNFTDDFIDSTNKQFPYLLTEYLLNEKGITTLDVSGWNLEEFESIDGLFRNCNYIEKIIGLHTLRLSNVYSAKEIFANCPRLDYSCVKNLNVKGIKNLCGAFSHNTFTDLNFLSNWDMSECEDIAGMFLYCRHLTNMDGIKNWNVSSLKNNFNSAILGINNLFRYCTSLTDIDLSNWTLGKDLIWVNEIFQDCYKLKSVKMFKATGTIIQAKFLFSDCEELERIENIENLNISNNVDCESMFYHCKKLSIDLRHWNLKATGSKTIKTGANKVKI